MRLERIAREVLLQDLWFRSIEPCPVYLIIVAEEQYLLVSSWTFFGLTNSRVTYTCIAW
jgi:hypothetical protein